MNFLKWAFRTFINIDCRLFGPAHAKTLQGRLHFRKKIDLKNPTTFSDKVVWLEYNTDLKQRARLTDKIAVRDYVKDKGLEEILVPIVAGPWRSIEEFSYSELPDSFVMKPSHGASGDVLICEDKHTLDPKYCKRKINKWLKEEYHAANLEPHYKLVPHGVYCEKIIDAPEDLVDYKFFCFKGKPWLVLTCSDRSSTPGSAAAYRIYDLKWNPVECALDVTNAREIPKPKNFDEMLKVASILSKELPFVRVDLYNVDGKVYFGELTFTPNGGISDEFNEEQELIGGGLLDISDLYYIKNR